MFDDPKPCPFCGGKAPIIVKDVQYPNTPNARTWYAIECNACDAIGDWDLGESGAIEKWNTRPGESALRAENERLHDIIQAAHDTFTHGGTDPADDDVISVLMAKILEEALT